MTDNYTASLAALGKTAASLKAYIDGCEDARYYGGPTIEPPNPINRVTASEHARDIARFVDAAQEKTEQTAAIAQYNGDLAYKAQAEVERLRGLLYTAETADFIKGVMFEAGHQVDRWATSHDAGKGPLDWFWLIGYLAQKAAAAELAGDIDKAKHHTISTAAALANWHRHLSGTETTMRPGMDPVARGIEARS